MVLPEKQLQSEIVNTKAITYSDMKILELLTDKEYANENIKKFDFSKRREIYDIFLKFGCYTLEETQRLALLTGLMPNNISKKYRIHIFKTARKNILNKLRYDRLTAEFIAKMPDQLYTFMRDAHEYHLANQYIFIKIDSVNIMKNYQCRKYLQEFSGAFNLSDPEQMKNFGKYVHRYFYDRSYKNCAELLKSYFKKFDFIGLIYLIFHYKDDIEPLFFKEDIKELKMKAINRPSFLLQVHIPKNSVSFVPFQTGYSLL